LLLIRGADDPNQGPDCELEIHQAVPGSQYLRLNNAGAFPFAESPRRLIAPPTSFCILNVSGLFTSKESFVGD
jgi:pimeloyl-ACP methyl ester carboxylesterase